jgi:hypothetical protein
MVGSFATSGWTTLVLIKQPPGECYRGGGIKEWFAHTDSITLLIESIADHSPEAGDAVSPGAVVSSSYRTDDSEGGLL